MSGERSTSFSKDTSFDTETPNSLDEEYPLSPEFKGEAEGIESLAGDEEVDETEDETGKSESSSADAEMRPSGNDPAWDQSHKTSYEIPMTADDEASKKYEEDLQSISEDYHAEPEIGVEDENDIDWENEP